MTTATQITRDMTIESIFSSFPHKAQKLANAVTKAGLQCVGCSAATWETLEAGMMGHGYNEEQITKLLNTLNQILLEESDPTTISLTERAASKFKAIAEQEGQAGAALRFNVIPAGCSGFEYELDFSKGFMESDARFQSHGVDIHVSNSALARLVGSEIDFVDGLNPGFKISNPNVKSSCGCGSSVGY